MSQKDRNELVHGDWKLQKVTDESMLLAFDCADEDLNEYFQRDALLHREALISQTPELPENKRYPFLPAVKITRFGVSRPFQGRGVGSHLLLIW